MKQLPYLRLAGLVCFLATVLNSACDVSLKDPNAESEREKVQLESWQKTASGSTYNYVKCSTSSVTLASNLCGSKVGADTTAANYSWHTNCTGDECGVISVFAHYMLTDNLGPQQTLRIEAFDNSTFANSPLASLEIAGFDASKPSSTSREEIYLAPGEYYFRAYLTHAGSTPVPYPLQGMELVSDAPVGVYGALSGAQRVLVKNTGLVADAVHIYIDQLFKKATPAVDSMAKIRLQLAVTAGTSIEKFRDVHVQLRPEADLELNPRYDFTVSSNTLLSDGTALDFVSPSLEPGNYYVFAYVDANSNSFVDAGELGSYVLDSGKPAIVTVDKNRTKTLSVQLNAYSK